MDFVSKRSQSRTPVFCCHWYKTEDKQGLEHWDLKNGAKEMVSTLHLQSAI